MRLGQPNKCMKAGNQNKVFDFRIKPFKSKFVTREIQNFLDITDLLNQVFQKNQSVVIYTQKNDVTKNISLDILFQQDAGICNI